MRGRKTGQDNRVVKQQDDLSAEDVIQHMAMKKRGEIAVFDAGKYFAGPGNRRLRIEETEEELDEDADAEAGGDLPLSPLPEFYTTSNSKHYTRKDQWQQAGNKAHVYAGVRMQNVPTTKTTGGAIASPAQRQTVTSIDPLRRDSLPSPPSIASAGRDRVCNEPRALPAANITNSTYDLLSQSKSSSTKPAQPFSPSQRFASFLAKFKLSSSESKPKPSSQYSNATPPTSDAAVPPPPKSFHPNATPLPANGKPPSPRGRFLRALSSSSSHSNPLLKPITHMHHHTSIAASTPVSPAGSDTYSPITHSASTTPSRKNPRSRPQSHVSYHESTSPGSRLSLPTTDWRRDIDNSSSRSLSTHLPFLRRKLKAYLMPEKSPRHHHENHEQVMNKQDKMNIHNDHHHVGNGARAEDRQQRAHKASVTSVSNKLDVASHLPSVDDRKQRAHKVSAASMDKPGPASYSSAANAPAQLDYKAHHGNTTSRSPGRRRTTEQPTTKDTQRRGDWRRHAEEMEDDIEVAERLLRVVKEHQTSQTYTTSYKGASNNRQQSKNGYANYQAKGQGGEMHGASSRKSRRSLMSPSSSPAANYHSKQASKEEFACPYDSDSSSDLFEIETLQAFSHVAGLYRPRDLPVYDSNPLKSPLHLK